MRGLGSDGDSRSGVRAVLAAGLEVSDAMGKALPMRPGEGRYDEVESGGTRTVRTISVCAGYIRLRTVLFAVDARAADG
jgi:hypothetical protein